MEQISSFQIRLKEAMNGMSATELAQMLGISKQSVSSYLNGTRQPKKLTMIAIANILSVSFDWLIGYDTSPHVEKIYERIRQRRLSLNMSQNELARRVGYVGRSAISKVENGERDISQSMIEKYAKALDVSIAWLMGFDVPMERAPSDSGRTDASLEALGLMPLPKMHTVPILGTIACGEQMLAEEYFGGEAQIPENIQADFALRCKDDGMIDFRILDGDIVYVKKQSTVENEANPKV